MFVNEVYQRCHMVFRGSREYAVTEIEYVTSAPSRFMKNSQGAFLHFLRRREESDWIEVPLDYRFAT